MEGHDHVDRIDAWMGPIPTSGILEFTLVLLEVGAVCCDTGIGRASGHFGYFGHVFLTGMVILPG